MFKVGTVVKLSSTVKSPKGVTYRKGTLFSVEKQGILGGRCSDAYYCKCLRDGEYIWLQDKQFNKIIKE